MVWIHKLSRLRTLVCGVQAILAGLVLTHGTIVRAETPPVFLLKWGTFGSADGQFNKPNSIDIGPAEQVFVADGLNYRIQVFAGDSTFLGKWGQQGSGEGEFLGPSGIAVDGSGIVYVTEGANRIQEFSSTGAFVRQFSAGGYSVAVDPTGSFIYTTGLTQVLQYTVAGGFVRSWVTPSGAGIGVELRGVAVGPSGNVYVTEGGSAHRLYKFTADGVLIGQWGGFGTGDGQFDEPNGVAVSGDENVYVCDSGNNRVEKFTSAGVFLTKWGSRGSGGGQFFGPIDLAVDGDDNIYVVDSGNERIQKFGSPVTPTRPTTWGRIKALYREPTTAGR